jgi:hypothetical protein
MKQVIVLIAPDGQTKVVAEGFTGGECRQATAFLREALGQQLDEQLTAAYFQSEATAVSQEIRPCTGPS